MPIKLGFISAPELLNLLWENEGHVLSHFLMDLGFLRWSKDIFVVANRQNGQGKLREAFSSWHIPEDSISCLVLRTVDECELSVVTVFATRLFLDF